MSKNAKPNVALCIAVSETSDPNSETAYRIYRQVQDGIDTDSAVLYNGNDEQIDVPFIARLRAMHPDFVEGAVDYEGPFEGWENVSHIYMVDGSRCKQDMFIDLVTKSFSSELICLWGETLNAAQTHPDIPVFLGDGCVAIHCDLIDETWFEYIIEGVH